MPAKLSLTLTETQRQQLQSYRDRHPLPYIRERAAALLQVAAGHSARTVAATKLLRVRDHETIATWVERYQDQGLDGLFIKAGRGRKPAFSPPAPNACSGARRTPAPGHSHATSRTTNGHPLAPGECGGGLHVAANTLALLCQSHVGALPTQSQAQPRSPAQPRPALSGQTGRHRASAGSRGGLRRTPGCTLPR